ncbi:uncharacterized protein V1518DRAFT_428890 [Limtongia smithiae]|uniref:uncharacterized protein n=1 Tax=Limtongia smithiae TaxID=1125753 RepID=UPI0034CDE737
MSDDASSAKRLKISTACNTCRLRKTRCDGERPACSYCRSTGGVCVYRTGGDQALINEQLILERLSQIEARLDAVKQPSIDVFTTSHATHLSISQGYVTPGQEFGLNMLEKPSTRHVQTPFFHTAGSHKMLHYWPRISIRLALNPGNPLKYIEETNEMGVPPLSVEYENSVVDLETVQFCIKNLHENCRGIGKLIGEFIQTYTDVPGKLLSLTSQSPSTQATRQHISLHDLDCISLLTLNLASWGAFQQHFFNPLITMVEDIQRQSFKFACTKLAELFFAADEYAIPFLILGAHVLIQAAYPTGALRLIQAAGERLGRCNKRRMNDIMWSKQYQECLKLHYIVESDILLTMDGIPSDATFAALCRLPDTQSFTDGEMSCMNMSIDPIAQKKVTDLLFESTLVLCSLQNKILVDLYTIEQAYSPPVVLAATLVELKSLLCAWFDRLPVHYHFPRDLSSMSSTQTCMPEQLEHLQTRYYILEFLMCRPVLYYIAHEKYEEYASASPDTSSTHSGELRRHPFWVYDACYRCLQCAALLILGNDPEHARRTAANIDWFELHMIWGAALTLLLSAATPSLANLLPKFESINALVLIEKAEVILHQHGQRSSIVSTCEKYFLAVKESLLADVDGASPLEEELVGSAQSVLSAVSAVVGE